MVLHAATKGKISVKPNPVKSKNSAVVKAKKRVANKKAKICKESLKRKLTRPQIDNLIVSTREDARRMAWRLLSSWRVSLQDDEVMSVVGVALCEAANRFDPTRGVNFKTFLFYHLRGMLIKEITAIFQEQRSCDLISPELLSDLIPGEQSAPVGWFFKRVDIDTPERIMQRKEVSEMFSNACANLDSLETEVVKRSFFDDEQLVDIADDLGYCRCHISRVKSRAVNLLQELLKGCHEDMGIALQKEPRGKTTSRSRKYTGGRGRRKQKESLLAQSA